MRCNSWGMCPIYVFVPTKCVQRESDSFHRLATPNLCFIDFFCDSNFFVSGFVIYKLKNGQDTSNQLGEDFFKYTLSTARSKSFVNLREVTGRFLLPIGTYVIVPSTYDPGYEGLFLLRTFTEKENLAARIGFV